MNTQLSVWSAYYIFKSPENAVLELKKHGVNASELSDEHGAMLLKRGDPKAVGLAYKKFLEQQEFTMTQGHLWLSCKICSDEQAVYKMMEWLDLFDAIGIKNAVLHLDAMAGSGVSEEERFQRNLEKLLMLQEHIKTEGLKLCICLENLGGIVTGIDEINSYIDRLDEDCFGICLDTGHLNLHDKDQRNFILKAGKRLRALHIADNEGKTDQHMMPYGRGNIDFDEVVKALREVDYQGLFNLEIPGENHRPDEIQGYKLEYIVKCYAYLMSEQRG